MQHRILLATLLFLAPLGALNSQVPPGTNPPPAESAPAQAPSPPKAQALAPDVWWIPGGIPDKRQPDGNSVVFRVNNGLIVFDTGRHAWHRQAILDFANDRKLPIEAVVNSHWHLDHVGGNAAIKAAFPQVRVYASNAIEGALDGFLKDSAQRMQEFLHAPGIPPEVVDDVRNDLEAIKNPAALRPDIVIRTTQTMAIAGRPLEIHLSANGPTAGDLWIYDPETRIVAAGDLVTLPAPFLDTACTAGWSAALEQLARVPFQTLVPGHGKPMSHAQLEQYRKAFDEYIACARSPGDVGDCATGWSRGVAELLAGNQQDPRFAQEMAGFYVERVLRPNGGDSRYCRSRP